MSCSPQLSPAAARTAARNCHSSETQQPEKQSASGLQPASVDGRIPDKRTSKSQNASWMYHDLYNIYYIYTSVTIQLPPKLYCPKMEYLFFLRFKGSPSFYKGFDQTFTDIRAISRSHHFNGSSNGKSYKHSARMC